MVALACSVVLFATGLAIFANPLLHSRQSIDVRGEADDAIALCKAIDAAIDAARREIEFYSQFELRSEWRDEPAAHIDDYDRFGVDSGADMERAEGAMMKLGDVVGLRFRLLTQQRNNDALYSYDLFENESNWVKYVPAQKIGNGKSLGEALYLESRSEGKTAVNPSMPGVYFSPWFSLGYAEGFLFKDRLASNQFLVTLGETSASDGKRLVAIRLALHTKPEEPLLEFLFDFDGKYPTLRERREGDFTLIRYFDHVELPGGVMFPSVAVISRGPFQTTPGGGEKFDVKLWRFTDLGNRAPGPDDFIIHASPELKPNRPEIEAGNGTISARDVLARSRDWKPGPLDVSHDIRDADEDWTQREVARTAPAISMRQVIWVVVGFIGIIAIGWWLRHILAD